MGAQRTMYYMGTLISLEEAILGVRQPGVYIVVVAATLTCERQIQDQG